MKPRIALACLFAAAPLTASLSQEGQVPTAEGARPAVTTAQVPGSLEAVVEDLHGTYRIQSAQRSGKEIPAERLQGITVRIVEKAITTYDKDQKQVYGASYTLDLTERPWKIKMTTTLAAVDGKGMPAEGLIEKQGNVIKLIYALPNGQPPKDFKAGPNQQLFVLEKVSEKPGEVLTK